MDRLQTARESFDYGDLETAARECRSLLKSEPRHAEALYLLGVIALQSGNSPLASECMRRALEITPADADCWNILGLSQTTLDQNDQAAESFERAVAWSDSPVPCNNLGSLRRKQGRIDDAIAAYRLAVARNPDFAQAHVNLGSVYRAQERFDLAAESFEKAIAADPSEIEALAGLGQVLRALGRTEEALKWTEIAIAAAPDRPELYCDSGDVLIDLHQIEKAVAAYQSAIRIQPDLARAWFSAGRAYGLQQAHTDAAACFRRALDLAPNWAAAQHDLGKALFNLGQVDEALRLFKKAVAGDHPELPQSMIALIIPGSSSASNQEILDARRAYAAHQPSPAERLTSGHHHVRRGRSRIGYVSSFFKFPNWMKPVWALLNHHDRARFQIHLFSECAAASIEQGYQPHPEDRFHDISDLSNQAAADCIKRAGIDILVDLNGYSKMRRLAMFSSRPAPVIAGWFNMYATTGMSFYDYLIGDDVVIPPDEEAFYTEKILRVPGSYLTFEVGYPAPDVVPPPGSKSGTVTFGCLASQYKITPEVVAVWCRILRAAPQSNLLLKNAMLGSSGTRQYVRELFEGHGIAPARLRLEGPSDHFQFLKTYAEIDVALDTFPYNGGTTTTEAIWQGVPVISFWGDRWVARTSASILRAANLGRFVSAGVDEYIRDAVRLANSRATIAELAGLRRGMRALLCNSPACDASSFARNMEALYTLIRA